MCCFRYRASEWREDRLCVLMELCDGGCVATLLRNYGAFRWNIVARSRPPFAFSASRACELARSEADWQPVQPT